MQIVIDIPDETYEEIKKSCYSLNHVIYGLKSEENRELFFQLMNAILDGTQIPKGHGRIIDESKINRVYAYTEEVICKNIKAINTIITNTDAPTIIEGE